MATLDLNKALRAVKTVINRGDGSGFPLAAKRQIRNALDVLAGKSGAPGGGITGGTGTVVKSAVTRAGELIKTEIYFDVTGLTSAATDADIIGDEGVAGCYLTRLIKEVNGTIVGGSLKCIEAPATGEIDFDLYSADEATGTEDALITGLTETKLVDSGGDWTDNREIGLTGVPDADANEYLYLAVGTASTPAAGTYTAGKFVLTLYGTA